MPRNGLTRERIVKEAARLIEENGYSGFSMRALAGALDIKAASLYNHIDSMDALLVDVCAYAIQMQREACLNAIGEKSGAEGIKALAAAYRQFAGEHRELYHLIINTAVSCGEKLTEISRGIIEPFAKLLEHTSLTPEEKIHWQRVLRCIVHGFVSQEEAGFFAHLPANTDDSFNTAIQCCVDGLAQAEKRRHV